MGAAKKLNTDRAQGRPVPADLAETFKPRILPPVDPEWRDEVIRAYSEKRRPRKKTQGEMF